MSLFSLPHRDPLAPARAGQLEAARKTYQYSYEWPPGVATAAEVPKSDTYSLDYIAHLIPVNAELLRNTLTMHQHVAELSSLESFVESELAAVVKLAPKEVGDWMFTVHQRASEHFTAEHVESVEEYGALFGSIPAVPAWSSWDDDRTFAWQRLAGVNPMSLHRITELPGNVGITEAHFQRARPGDSLAAALAEGRAFGQDYAVLDGAVCGVTNGRQKYLHAPYVLFVASGGELHPVAIQLGQTPDTGVFVAGDGANWRMAKLAAQVAEASYHETTVHLGRTHMVMEAVTLATQRQLAKTHPLNVLLLAHCAYTLPINHSAATNLIAPGGVIDIAFAGAIETSAALVKTAIETHPIRGANPAADLAARGLDDREVLPVHPYRDDGLPVWEAIRQFVGSYVDHHYSSDEEVGKDTELAAWVAELGASDGGRLVGVDAVRTREQLAQLVATFVWTGTAQHSAVNFTQFPFMGAIPNIAGALWAPWPRSDVSETEAHLQALPPMNIAIQQFNTVYQLSGLRVNYLGKYGLTTFLDLDVRRLVSAFGNRLEQVERDTVARNEGRYMSYPHLLPSTIPNSIHI